MDLSTTYLGLELPNPFMPGASPLADDLDTVRRLEDAGAAAIVLRSLFEEQITGEQLAIHHFIRAPADSYGKEALWYIPDPEDFALGPEDYLEQLRRVKEAVQLPVIASLNGKTPGRWLEYASRMEEAGADAIELNVYHAPTDPEDTSACVEDRIVEVVRIAVNEVDIPVAVKVSPLFTSVVHLARRLGGVGAKGLVLFSRLYQPDIDPEKLEVVPALHLSDSTELKLRLRWLAILSGRVTTSLAVTGGVHTPTDAIKAIMAGAHGVQIVSALLRNGPEYLRVVREGVVRWMTEREYESLNQMRGSMDHLHRSDKKEVERSSQVRVLQSSGGFV